MQVVASRLGLRGHHAGDGKSELRIIVLRRDLRFNGGLESRIDDNDSKDGVLVVSTERLLGGSLFADPVVNHSVSP